MRQVLSFFLFCVVVFVSGCVSQRSLGDRMIETGNQTRTMGDQWKKGHKLVEKGERLRSRSEKQIETGRANLAKAEKQIQQGRELIVRNEAMFQASQSADQY